MKFSDKEYSKNNKEKTGRTYITGDIHGDTIDLETRFANSKNIPDLHELTKKDVVIILGDTSIAGNRKAINHLEKFRNVFCIIDGNHEPHEELLYGLETTDVNFSNTTGIVGSNIYYLQRGKHYVINEQHFFSFGGARSIDAEYRKKCGLYLDEELEVPSEDEFTEGKKVLEVLLKDENIIL